MAIQLSGSLAMSGSIIATGEIIAQMLNVQQVTSSVIYSSGSNIFGNSLSNTQQFTGSVLVTGSLTVSGPISGTGPTQGTIVYGSTVACSPVGCFATSCATSFVGGTISGTTGTFTGTVIAGNGSSQTEIRINSSGGNNEGPFLRFQKGGANTAYIGAYSSIINGTSNDLTYYAVCSQQWMTNNNTATKMLLDGSGNLTVGSADAGNAGTINVSVGAAGTTAGGLQLWAASNQTHYIQFGDGTTGGQPYAGYVSYAHGTDSLAFGTATATRAIISSTGITCFSNTVCTPILLASGCIGIGTTDLSNGKLNIGGNTDINLDSGTIGMRFRRIATVGYLGTGDWAVNGLSTYDFGISSGYCSGALVFGTSAGVERMRITSTGDARFNCSILVNNFITLCNPSSCASLTLIQNPANATANTGGEIVFAATYRATADYTEIARIRGLRENATSGNWAGYLAFYTSPGNDSPSASTERMRITSAGDIGIGLTTPQYALSIQRTGNVALHFSTNGCYTGDCIDITGGGNCTVTNGNSAFRIRSVITAPSGKATGNLGFWVNCGDMLVERMHIGCTGNVGIRNTSPSNLLSVGNGNIGTGCSLVSAVINAKGGWLTNEFEQMQIGISALRSTYNDSNYWSLSFLTTTNSTAGLTERMRIAGDGVAIFSCQVCAPQVLITNNIRVGTTYGTTAQYSFGSTVGAQTTANLTDAGVQCGILEVLATGGAAGNGGALMLGSDTWGTGAGKGQIALKALLVNGSGCGTSDLAFSLRNDPSCANLTERMRITVGGQVAIGTTSTSAEANLFLGARTTIEGGQMVFQKGTSCSCATHLDNYADSFRILVGDDTGTNGVHMLIDHKTRTACFYGQVQTICGINSAFYNGFGCRYNFTALNTPQQLVSICANNGILVIRDHTAGGTGAFLIDPNMGVICMASNIPATVSIAYHPSGGLWCWCLTSGSVPRCLGYGFYGA